MLTPANSQEKQPEDPQLEDGEDPRVVFTYRRRCWFLDLLLAGMTVQAAARRAGVSRKTCYAWRRRDRAFAMAWHDFVRDAKIGAYLDVLASRRAERKP